jgi:hypothetical protein
MFWKRRGAYRVWWRNLTEGDHLEDTGISRRIILKLTFGKWIMRIRLG